MAVSKLWSVTNNLTKVINYAVNPEKTAADNFTEEQYQALRDVLTYAKNEEKTELEFFVEGINCNPSTAREHSRPRTRASASCRRDRADIRRRASPAAY
mgnify:CR=1 FL=1